MPRTKEEAIRLGIKIQPLKHNKKRRAIWHDYTRRGMYILTIHIYTDEEGRCYEGMLLSHIVGNPMASHDTATYPHPELTELGRMVDYKINAISSYTQFKEVEVKGYTIMPTHVHIILEVKRDLPYYCARKRNYHLGDLVRGFKQGCTSLFKRWLRGKSADEILGCLPSVNGGESGCRNGGESREKSAGVNAKISMEVSAGKSEHDRTYTTTPGGKSDITLWEDKYNDRVLIDEKSITAAYEYVKKNAWYWQMETLYPQLFKHVLHLGIGGIDYSAYGCLFLLKRPLKRQVFCHRLARRSQLTDEEWQKATESWDAIRAFEKHAREHKLGHFDREWYRNNRPDCTTAVDYTRTEAFRKEKAEHMKACEEMGAVLVSPAVSAGEAAICYEALEQGYPVIKLQKEAITAKAHPANRDRAYCGKGIMVVLGPWEIKGDSRPLTDRKSERMDENDERMGKGDSRPLTDRKGERMDGNGERTNEKEERTDGKGYIPRESLYAKFHNLNDMAAELCTGHMKEYKIRNLSELR